MGTGGMTTIVISLDAAPLLDVARQVLDSEDLPDAALIGGLAVTVRVASPATLYRATADIDIVTGDETPTLVQILTTLHDTGEPIVIDGIRVDVIATAPVSDRDLEGIDDGPRLFVASHRWALETAEAVTLTTTAPTAEPFTVRVATPAALVAAKAHAVGFARSQRRSTKHGSDLLDVYRLVDLHNPGGELAAALRTAPGQLAPVIARVIRSAFLMGPTKAASLMTPPGSPLIDADDITDLMESFARQLDAP